MLTLPDRHSPVRTSALAKKWAWLAIGWSLVFSVATAAENGAGVAPRKDYAQVIDAQRPFIQREMAEKQLPALSIAIVDDPTDRLGPGVRIGGPREQETGNRGNHISDRLGFETVHGHRYHAAGRTRRTELGCSDHRLSP